MDAAAGSVAGVTRRLVPWVIVMGRSVFGRTVRQGTPSIVVSSCTPPESVTTSAAPRTSERNSTYPSGSMIVRLSPVTRPASARRPRPRGCSGTTIGTCSLTASTASTSSRADSGSSTFPGRCSVATAYRSGRARRSFSGSGSSFGSAEKRLSIMGLPTRCTLPGETPSLARWDRPSGLVTSRMSASASVTTRLTSSGISRSKDRRPASTCAVGIWSFAQTRIAASVELTSP